MNNLTWKDLVMGLLMLPLYPFITTGQWIKRKLDERRWR